MYYINECAFEELPSNLQDRIEEQGNIDDFEFFCPFCGSPEIKKTDLSENGEFIYGCEDCDAEFSGEKIVIN